MKITVHPETLRVTGQRSYKVGKEVRSYETFGIEVTIGTDRREIRCNVQAHHVDPKSHNIDLYDLAVRFSTGDKVWPGTATYWPISGNVNGLRPNIDKRGYFSLVGYAEDFAGKAVRSQHNAVA